MKPHLTRDMLQHQPMSLLHRGRLFNATLWRVGRGGDWVVKDFGTTPWFYRWTLGRWAAGHEYRVVNRLQGISGVPRQPFRVDALAWGYRFVEGDLLHLLSGARCSTPFFSRLEALTRQLHARGIVHLDLRNARNVVVDAAGEPHIIDFQTALGTRRLPAAVRRPLERIDLSGVYKHWLLRDADHLGPAREAVLYWQLRLRHLWPLRGYRLPGRRRLYEEERLLLKRQRAARAMTRASRSPSAS